MLTRLKQLRMTGTRAVQPVTVDRDLIVGEALILETYCAEQLEKYQGRFGAYEFDNTIRN